ncbi:MAG: hypothetical protein FGM47_04895 [Candidatus Nanopelagicaceae bacterium]|nr:hypothetical protein [Candidatus Nanopelagicaceae bacterium]
MRNRDLQDDSEYEAPKYGPGWSAYQSIPEGFDLEEWEDLTFKHPTLNIRQKLKYYLIERFRYNASNPTEHDFENSEYIQDLEFEENEDDDHFSKVIDLLFELHELNYERYKIQAKSLIKTKRLSYRIGQASISYRLTRNYCRYKIEFDSDDVVQVEGDARTKRRKRQRIEELTTIFAQCEAHAQTPQKH